MCGSRVQIREATVSDGPSIARVHIDSTRTAYRGVVPDEYLAALDYDQRSLGWSKILGDTKNLTRMFVADDDVQGLVGFASGGPERQSNAEYDGEIYAIYLLEAHQRKAVGRQLVAALANRLQSEGMNSMLVWALLENPAHQFYETLSGSFVTEQDIEIGGKTLREVAYGWEDISALIKA